MIQITDHINTITAYANIQIKTSCLLQRLPMWTTYVVCLTRKKTSNMIKV